MRKWLALLATVAVLAVAGTALAMTGSDKVADDEVATETTLKVEETTTTIEEKAEPERTVEVDEVEKVEKEEVVWEEPDEYVPYEPSDHNPPAIEILYPGDGQVFEKHEVSPEPECSSVSVRPT